VDPMLNSLTPNLCFYVRNVAADLEVSELWVVRFSKGRNEVTQNEFQIWLI
jgi:hypothetical protein